MMRNISFEVIVSHAAFGSSCLTEEKLCLAFRSLKSHFRAAFLHMTLRRMLH